MEAAPSRPRRPSGSPPLPGLSGNCPAGCGDSWWRRSSVYAAALAVAAVRLPLRLHDLEVFGVLLAFGVATVELTRRTGEPAGLVMDLHAVWYLPAALLLPPLYGLIAPIPVLVLSQLLIRRTLIYRRAFTAAAIGLSLGAASLVFHAALHPVGASVSGSPSSQLRWVLLAGGLRGAADPDQQDPGGYRGQGIGADGEPAPACLGPRGRLQRRRRALPLRSDRVPVAHISIMIAFALPFVTLLQRSFRHTQLAGEARIDGKTGLLNAVTWQREAHTEVSRAVRLAPAGRRDDGHRPLQDGQRHPRPPGRGRGAGGNLRRAARPAARLRHRGRFGGEEFAILLPRTTAAEARDIAERLRLRIAEIITPVTAGAESVPLRIPCPSASPTGRGPPRPRRAARRRGLRPLPGQAVWAEHDLRHRRCRSKRRGWPDRRLAIQCRQGAAAVQHDGVVRQRPWPADRCPPSIGVGSRPSHNGEFCPPGARQRSSAWRRPRMPRPHRSAPASRPRSPRAAGGRRLGPAAAGSKADYLARLAAEIRVDHRQALLAGDACRHADRLL